MSSVMRGRTRIGHVERCPAGDEPCWHAHDAEGRYIGREAYRQRAVGLVRDAASARVRPVAARNGEEGHQDPSTARRPVLRLLQGGK